MSAHIPIPSSEVRSVARPHTGQLFEKENGISRNNLFDKIGEGEVVVRHDLQKGDAFVILSLPPGAHVGCDTTAGTVKEPSADCIGTDSFCGFCDIPPGIHFTWVSAPSAMSRQGYWYVTNCTPGTLRVKQWDRANEILGECTNQRPKFLADDISAVFAQLLPYDVRGSQPGNSCAQTLFNPAFKPSTPSNKFPSDGLWGRLTSCISELVLGRITCAKSSVAQSAPTEWLFTTTDTAEGEFAIPGGGRPAGYTEFSFLFAKDDLDAYRLVASREKADELHNTKIRSHATSALDTTERIVVLLEYPHSQLTDSDIIGEMQFCFLTGILLSNMSCLEQWWHLVLKVFLRARGLGCRRPSLCRSFLETLHCQFIYLERYVPGAIPRLPTTALPGEGEDSGTSIFDAKPYGAARLRASLSVFKLQFTETLGDHRRNASPQEAAAYEAFVDFEAFLWKYGWDLRSDHVTEAVGGSLDDSEGDEEIEVYNSPLQQGAQVGARHSTAHSALSDSDSDSDQPIVVEFNDDGREAGLVSWN